MQQNGTIDINETVHAWADIVLKIWHNKITELQVYDTGALYESLKNSLFTAAGNDVNKVEFSFQLYGIFVDMGVGKEIEKGMVEILVLRLTENVRSGIPVYFTVK